MTSCALRDSGDGVTSTTQGPAPAPGDPHGAGDTSRAGAERPPNASRVLAPALLLCATRRPLSRPASARSRPLTRFARVSLQALQAGRACIPPAAGIQRASSRPESICARTPNEFRHKLTTFIYVYIPLTAAVASRPTKKHKRR